MATTQVSVAGGNQTVLTWGSTAGVPPWMLTGPSRAPADGEPPSRTRGSLVAAVWAQTRSLQPGQPLGRARGPCGSLQPGRPHGEALGQRAREPAV